MFKFSAAGLLAKNNLNFNLGQRLSFVSFREIKVVSLLSHLAFDSKSTQVFF